MLYCVPRILIENVVNLLVELDLLSDRNLGNIVAEENSNLGIAVASTTSWGDRVSCILEQISTHRRDVH